MTTAAQTIGSTIGAIGLTSLATLSMAAFQEEFVAAVFPPWWSAERALVAGASAGEIVKVGKLSTIIVVHGKPEVLAGSLWRAGALLVLGAGTPIVCSQSNSENAS